MVRITLEKNVDTTDDGNIVYAEMFGLSTDTKPTGLYATGSKFVEVDTGKKFAYDETESGSWIEQA